jgi:transposase
MDGTVGDGSCLRTTGAGRGDAVCRRRRWSAACKAAIVAESFVAGTRVSEIAARHGLQAKFVVHLASAGEANGTTIPCASGG